MYSKKRKKGKKEKKERKKKTSPKPDIKHIHTLTHTKENYNGSQPSQKALQRLTVLSCVSQIHICFITSSRSRREVGRWGGQNTRGGGEVRRWGGQNTRRPFHRPLAKEELLHYCFPGRESGMCVMCVFAGICLMCVYDSACECVCVHWLDGVRLGRARRLDETECVCSLSRSRSRSLLCFFQPSSVSWS